LIADTVKKARRKPVLKKQIPGVDQKYVRVTRPSLLGLVAETLFMAILLHALLALVLVDLCFTAFLNRAHGIILGWGSMKIRAPAC